MKKSIWMSSALAAAAMALAGPAAAVSSAMATITGFSITLYDLDPGDSIVPELTFTSASSQSSARVYSASEDSWALDSQPGNFVPSSAMVMLAFGHAHAETDASSAMAMGHVSGPVYGGYGASYGYAYGVASSFTLTPWTGMKLTLTFDGTASTGPGTGSEFADAMAYLQTTIYTPDGYELHYSNREAYAGCGWDGSACSGESDSFSGTFSLSYANFSDLAAEGNMSAYAYAYGQSTMPVPEPQTYLMLLAGLAGIGFVVGRRRAG
jgi:hypothetical protein